MRYPETGRTSDGAADRAIPQRQPVPTDAVPLTAGAPGVADAAGNLVLPMQLATLDNRLLGHPAPERNLGFAWLGDSPMNPLRLEEGDPPTLPNEIVVDRATADRDGVRVGDRMKLVTPGGTFTVDVSGVVGYGTARGLNGRAIVAFSPTLLELAGQRGGYLEILVRLDAGADAPSVTGELRALVAARGLEVVDGATWRQEQADILAAPLEAAAFFLTFFTYITVGVAAILIANTFLVVMQRRTREVALLRLVGMTQRAVTTTLLLEALLVGVLFAVPGAAVGLVAAQVVAGRLRGLGIDLPGFISLVNVDVLAVPLVSGVLVTVLSAVAPARRTAATPPVAAFGEATLDERALNPRRRQRAVAPLVAGAAAVAWGIDRGAPVSYGVGIAYLVVAFALAGPSLIAGGANRLARRIPAPARAVTRLAVSSPRRHPERSFATAAALTVGVGIFSFFAVFVSTAAATAARTATAALNGEVIITGTGVSVANLPDSVPSLLRASGEFAAVSAIRVVNGSDADGRLESDEPKVAGIDEAFFSLWKSGATDAARAMLLADQPGEELPALVLRREAGSLRPGDTVRIGLPFGVAVLRIVGFVEQTLPGFSAPSLFVDERALRRHGPAPVGFVLVDGHDQPTAVRDRARELLANEPTAVVRTAEEFRGVGGAELDQLLAVARLLLAMAVVLAVLGVANTMVLTVRERSREMALLRAVGAQRRDVRALVLLEGEVLAALGSLAGLTIGTAIAVGTMKSVPTGNLGAPDIPWTVLAVGGSVALLAVALATAVPALRASRAPILEGLQHP